MIKFLDKVCDGFLYSFPSVTGFVLFCFIDAKGLYDRIVDYAILLIGLYISGLLIEKNKNKK